jgi:hypothetical protein
MKMKSAIVVGVLGLAAVAFASNVHLKPPNRDPGFTDGGLFLASAGNLAGLGLGDVVVSITALADVTSTCTNQGGTQAPGQNPAPITVSGSVSIPEDELKNGNTPFAVATTPPAAVIPGAPDCPNPNWTEEIEDLAFTSATITVEQPAGTTVLTVLCTFSPPTSDGVIPDASVSCDAL